ncbi:MAG: beta-ketoacyl-ACP synthase III [Bacteroidota bacterium]
MQNEVYITNAAIFLPNKAVLNDEMEEYLGLIHKQQSKSKRIVLRNNGIKQRYYAIDKNGNATHTNAQMASLAIRNLFDNDAAALSSIDLLCCGTSSPDQIMPAHGVMVHGWLPETSDIEVITPAGNCCSGMHALKYAFMSVKLGQAQNAVVSGSERLSRILYSETYEEEATKLDQMSDNPYISFDKEFLRWMLSDGAAAVRLGSKKNENGICLRIDWLEGASYAHKIEPCMYQGSDKINGVLKGYMDFSQHEVMEHSVLSIKQDVKLLSENVVRFGIDKLAEAMKRNNLKPGEVDFFLPHMSSEFFRKKIADKMELDGIPVPQEKWFSNLSTTGNVGSASIYFMIEELMRTNRLKKGDKLLMIVPESARFSYVYGQLTVC